MHAAPHRQLRRTVLMHLHGGIAAAKRGTRTSTYASARMGGHSSGSHGRLGEGWKW
jgi:hypothetical protein